MDKLVFETKVGVWRITEMRDDCVYSTEYVEDRWVIMGSMAPEGFIYSPPDDYEHPRKVLSSE